MTEPRDYFAEFEEHAHRVRATLNSAGREVNYMRGMVACLARYLPKDHPYWPGVNDIIARIARSEIQTEVIDSLVDQLDSKARNYWVAEYGLPHAIRDEMRGIVRAWLQRIPVKVSSADVLNSADQPVKAQTRLDADAPPPAGVTNGDRDFMTDEELDRHLRDAARYEWLRENWCLIGTSETSFTFLPADSGRLDEVINAAIAREEQRARCPVTEDRCTGCVENWPLRPDGLHTVPSHSDHAFMCVGGAHGYL